MVVNVLSFNEWMQSTYNNYKEIYFYSHDYFFTFYYLNNIWT